MAQFIQGNQLSPLQGGIGNQQIVRDQSPNPGKLVEGIGRAFETAGNIYATDKGKALVEEEMGNIDQAVAAAESGKFTAGDPVPESLALDQKEWDMLSSAVASGNMTRDRARLIASSRLRTRIAEEPFFADRMRKAASGILGFNIESEQAQQYFASFPTRAEAGSGTNEYRQKLLEEAQVWVDTGLVSNIEEAYQFRASVDFAKQRKAMAAAQLEIGSANAQQYTTDMEVADAEEAFGTVLGTIRGFEQEQGKPVDAQALNRIIDETKQNYIAEFNAGWVKAGGQLNTPDYVRAKDQIESRYAGYKEFVESVGMDNLNKIQIARAEQMRKMMGDQFFPQMKFITENFGQQVASDLINIASMNKTQRDLVLSQNPELQRAFEVLNADPRAFTKQMFNTSRKIMSGEELTDADAPYVDYVARTAHDQGGQETKESVIEGLAAAGQQWKATSILAESSPRLEPQANVETYKRNYKENIAPLVDQLSAEVATTPGISLEVGNDGRVSVIQDSAAGALPSPTTGGLIERPQQNQQQIVAFNRAKQLADKLNVFAKGHRKGWSKVVGEDLQEYRGRIKKEVETRIASHREEFTLETLNTFQGHVEAGDFDSAREQYESLRRLDPEQYPETWEEIQAEASRINQQAGAE